MCHPHCACKLMVLSGSQVVKRHRERKTEDPEIRTQLLQATLGRTFVQYLDLILHGPLRVLPKRITHTCNIIAIPVNEKRDTDDKISSSTHRYTNCIAPSYSVLN